METKVMPTCPARWKPLAGFVLLFLLLALAPAAFAQNCAMCYDSARQQSSEASRALNTGIIVLLLPSLLLFGGVIVTAMRHKMSGSDDV